jgi:TetR/AcrR family transcriptional regulator, mexJK operon transcriptional repressor
MASVLDSRKPNAAVGAGRGSTVGGAGPKGEAIAAAALRLFLRDGYERTSVDAIAAEAGVSKRTIYSRYGDKETLFRSVLRDTFTSMMATFAQLADTYLARVTDVEQDLTAFALQAALTLTNALDRIALMRLILSEAPYFPALLRDELRQQTMHETLARALARLGQDGQLAVPDTSEAAEHLFALTFGQVSSRSLFSTAPLPQAEVERIVTSGVAVFLRAYRGA